MTLLSRPSSSAACLGLALALCHLWVAAQLSPAVTGKFAPLPPLKSLRHPYWRLIHPKSWIPSRCGPWRQSQHLRQRPKAAARSVIAPWLST